MTGKRPQIAVLLLSLLFLTSCGLPETLGGTELGRRLLIEAVGIDREQDGVLLTLLTPDLFAEETENETPPVSVLQFSADTVSGAVEEAKRQTGRSPFFGYARFLALGRKAAETDALGLLSYFIENRAIRTDSPVCVAEPDAAGVLGASFVPAGAPAKSLEDVLTGNANSPTPFFRFVSLLMSPNANASCPLLSLTRQKDGVLPNADAEAVFPGAGGFFTLDREQTLLFRALEGNLSAAAFSDAENGTPVLLRQIRRRIRKTPEGLRITVRATMNSPRDPRTMDLRQAEALKRRAESMLTDKASELLIYLYKKRGTDPLNLCGRVENAADRSPEKVTVDVRFVLKN